MPLYKTRRKKRFTVSISRTFPALVLLISLACSLPTLIRQGGDTPAPSNTPAPPTPTARPLPPTLVEVEPPPGVELPLNAQVTFYFNQPMQPDSVESELRMLPAPSGEFTWVDAATLVFNPSQALSPQSNITFELGSGMRSAEGLSMPQTISLTYQTAGYLRLEQSLPEPGAQEVNPTSAVVAAFNRPVVTLGSDGSTGPAAFSLEPAAQGRGEWINTSTYIFYPEPPLLGGENYTVRLNPDLRSLDGSPLSESNSQQALADEWSFTTLIPRLDSFELADPSGLIKLDHALKLTFNQPMDSSSVEAEFSMRTPGGQQIPGKFEWDDDFMVLTFKPQDLLARNQEYAVRLGSGARALSSTALESGLDTTVRSVPTLAVDSSNPIENGIKRQYEAVVLTMNGPIDQRQVLRHILFDPQVPNLDFWWDESAYALNLYGDFSPNTAYTLRLAPGLPDPWGGTMGQEYRLRFVTASLDPNLFVTTGSAELFITPQDATITAQATNLFNLSLSSGSLTLADFIALVSSENAYELRRSFRSPDQRDWQQPLDIPFNRSQEVELFVTPNQQPLNPGLHYLRLNFSDQNIFAGPYLLVVSNVQLTFKMSATGVLVWAVDLRDSSPVVGAPVAIYDDQGQLLVDGRTGEDGIFQGAMQPLEDAYSTFYAVMGQPGEDLFGLALSTWNMGTSPWEFGLSGELTPPALEAYLYTDRPIYRPDQTVYFRAVVRQAYNGRYSLPELSSLPLSLYDHSGEEVANFDLPLSEFGTAHGEFNLPADARPGYYRLASKVSEYGISVDFQVAEYRKPEINLQVAFDAEQVLAGQAVDAQVNARYFFDAPAGNLSVQWTLLSAPAFFELPTYQVGVADTSWLNAYDFPGIGPGWETLVDQGEATTDAQGLLALQFPTKPIEARQRYILEITASDESGLPVSARASVVINPAEFFIGLRPDTWIGRAGEQSGFEVQVVDWTNQPAGERSLRAEFLKVVWIREEPQTSDPYRPTGYRPEYTQVGSADFRTSQQGQARLSFTPPEPGTYQLAVSAGSARSELLLWVGGPGQAIWPDLTNQRLRLAADRREYQPGDTAQVFVPNPFAATAQALVSVERGVVLDYQVLELPPTGDTLSFPLSGDDAPNVYLSVLLLGKDTDGHPDFRQGYINLPVTPTEQTLNVALLAQPERAAPGEQVSIELQVTDQNNLPVQGEFSLSVVDQAVLALSDPNIPDILPAFYGQQPLGIRTGLALSAYGHRRITTPPGLGGGGGGEASLPLVRQSFPDTAFWDAEIITNENGRASLSLSLPDSLTTWQVLARGLTEDTRVGQARVNLITTKDLLVRPVVPRFFVVGDHLQLAAILQNNTVTNLQVEASLQTSGFSLDDSATALHRVELPAGGRSRLEWWGSVEDVESVDLVFTASSGDLRDAARPAQGKIPVLRYTAFQTFSTSGILDQPGEKLELVSLPRSFDPGSGSLQLELSTSLAGSVLQALEVLEASPYKSTEQTISSLLTNLEIYQLLEQYGVTTPDSRSRLKRSLDDSLTTLTFSQNSDGGWGWWQGSQSDTHITAYVLFGLSQARQSGNPVNDTVVRGAIDYLLTTLVSPQMLADTWQLDRLALVQFSLAQAGAGDLAGVEALHQVSAHLNPWSQALLALAYESLEPASEQSRERSQTLFSGLATSALRSGAGAHWEEREPGWQNMSSPLQTTAIVVYALAQHDPTSPLLADAARYLVRHRQVDKGWSSTYATAWAILALSKVMLGTGELAGNFAYSAELNGLLLASGQAGSDGSAVIAEIPSSALSPDRPNALTIQREPGSGRLYYSAALNVSRPAETAAPLERGISLERGYYLAPVECAASACAPLQGAKSGQLVQVRLSLTLQNDSHYLVVEDYLPAGAEILDTSLKTSQQFLGPFEEPQPAPLYNVRQPFSAGWGWWLFNNPRIYDDHIAWTVDYLPAGTYELTYTLVISQPGEYRVLPAHAWQFYFPDVEGSSAGEIFSITP